MQALHEILQAEAPEGWYLLLDRTQGDPLASEQLAACFPEPAVTVLNDAFFAHAPEQAPLLINLAETVDFGSEERRSWLKRGTDDIEDSLRKGGAAMVSAWLQSAQPAEQVARHLKRLFVQPHPDGRQHHLRYYDPRVTRLLDQSLSGEDKNQLLGPIDHWCYPAHPAGYRHMGIDETKGRASAVSLRAEHWAQLDWAAHYHKLLRTVAGLSELHPDTVAAQWPDFPLALQWLREAAALPWVDTEDEAAGCVALWWLLGRDCEERYPNVAAELEQYRQDRAPTLTEWLLFAGAEFWNKPSQPPLA